MCNFVYIKQFYKCVQNFWELRYSNNLVALKLLACALLMILTLGCHIDKIPEGYGQVGSTQAVTLHISLEFREINQNIHDWVRHYCEDIIKRNYFHEVNNL